jgi:PKD repeat protein
MKNNLTFKNVLTTVCFFLSIEMLFSNTPMHLRIDASGSNMQSGTTVFFYANGSIHNDSINDTPALGVLPGYLHAVTQFDGIDYVIKGLPLLIQDISIPIKITTGTNASYQISLSDIDNIPAGACLMLHDNFTNTNSDLRLGAYTCTVTDTETVARFVLTISISVFPVSGNSLNPTCISSANGFISAGLPSGTGPWNYYWKDSLNNIINTSLGKTAADTLFGVNAGAYRVDITADGTCSNGTYNYYLQATSSPAALFSLSTDTVDFLTPVIFTNTSVNATEFWWEFGDGMGSNNVNDSEYYVSPGTFTVTLTANNLTCGDTSRYSKEIKVLVQTTHVQKAQAGNIFISRDGNGYYVSSEKATPREITISVSDITGRKMCDDEKGVISGNKVYVNTSNSVNQALIISASCASGETIYKKVVN